MQDQLFGRLMTRSLPASLVALPAAGKHTSADLAELFRVARSTV
jgi:hypothetical protein